ncbi:uncharacterized protein LOC110744859 [Prunus avium]|uniref:Uncharacterized protein LOC110744859 n=1 Tax=Prunus avium TaxID=42229 RepID=A0A6P5RCS4_PRUAV|nr:uncharacterized protein LOC110744859 [Prunus avium]
MLSSLLLLENKKNTKQRKASSTSPASLQNLSTLPFKSCKNRLIMFLTVVSSLIFTDKRMAMQIFPESVRKIWNEWELRAMVLISLSLQAILILIGSWRKHSTSNILRIVLWLAYLSADSVATVSLGILSNNQEDSPGDSVNPDYIITAFWAPFLLLHLGGPDTITAYSLEDNELWLRHLLGVAVQVLVAFYVFLRAWSNKVLNFLAIPMFIVGIIKFGERTWVLRSASSEHFRESMLPHPDPGPNYARYMEEYSSKKAEGFKVELGPPIEAPKAENNSNDAGRVPDDSIQKAVILNKAYSFFETFKRLCADLILSFQNIEKSQTFFQNRNSEQAFEVIEIELGFMYDVFYTRAVLVHSRLGGILRCISLSLTVSVFLAFLFKEKHSYTGVDVAITYVLLVGAIILEMYAVVMLLSSDWTTLQLNKHKNGVLKPFHKAVSSIPLVKNNRWSNKLGQYNLITFCLKKRPAKCIFIKEDLFINKLLEKYRYQDSEDVSTELTNLIFMQLKEKSKSASNFDACKQLCANRGAQALHDAKCANELGWAIDRVEFEQSILLWHIATDLCYNADVKGNSDSDAVPNQNCKNSKQLSNYMLYLLVMCSFMLPNGIGQIRFQDTCAEAEDFFTERKSITDEEKACAMLLKVSTDISPSEVKGDRSKSVLFDACRLAKALQSMEVEGHWGTNEKKWELVSQVWVEMLSYAANRCRWSDHAQQLRRGGELLTHVWLLMAHLGLTEQFQISEGHKRAKLVVQ